MNTAGVLATVYSNFVGTPQEHALSKFAEMGSTASMPAQNTTSTSVPPMGTSPTITPNTPYVPGSVPSKPSTAQPATTSHTGPDTMMTKLQRNLSAGPVGAMTSTTGNSVASDGEKSAAEQVKRFTECALMKLAASL